MAREKKKKKKSEDTKKRRSSDLDSSTLSSRFQKNKEKYVYRALFDSKWAKILQQCEDIHKLTGGRLGKTQHDPGLSKTGVHQDLAITVKLEGKETGASIENVGAPPYNSATQTSTNEDSKSRVISQINKGLTERALSKSAPLLLLSFSEEFIVAPFISADPSKDALTDSDRLSERKTLLKTTLADFAGLSHKLCGKCRTVLGGESNRLFRKCSCQDLFKQTKVVLERFTPRQEDMISTLQQGAVLDNVLKRHNQTSVGTGLNRDKKHLIANGLCAADEIKESAIDYEDEDFVTLHGDDKHKPLKMDATKPDKRRLSPLRIPKCKIIFPQDDDDKTPEYPLKRDLFSAQPGVTGKASSPQIVDDEKNGRNLFSRMYETFPTRDLAGSNNESSPEKLNGLNSQTSPTAWTNLTKTSPQIKFHEKTVKRAKGEQLFQPVDSGRVQLFPKLNQKTVGSRPKSNSKRRGSTKKQNEIELKTNDYNCIPHLSPVDASGSDIVMLPSPLCSSQPPTLYPANEDAVSIIDKKDQSIVQENPSMHHRHKARRELPFCQPTVRDHESDSKMNKSPVDSRCEQSSKFNGTFGITESSAIKEATPPSPKLVKCYDPGDTREPGINKHYDDQAKNIEEKPGPVVDENSTFKEDRYDEKNTEDTSKYSETKMDDNHNCVEERHDSEHKFSQTGNALQPKGENTFQALCSSTPSTQPSDTLGPASIQFPKDHNNTFSGRGLQPTQIIVTESQEMVTSSEIHVKQHPSDKLTTGGNPTNSNGSEGTSPAEKRTSPVAVMGFLKYHTSKALPENGRIVSNAPQQISQRKNQTKKMESSTDGRDHDALELSPQKSILIGPSKCNIAESGQEGRAFTQHVTNNLQQNDATVHQRPDKATGRQSTGSETLISQPSNVSLSANKLHSNTNRKTEDYDVRKIPLETVASLQTNVQDDYKPGNYVSSESRASSGSRAVCATEACGKPDEFNTKPADFENANATSECTESVMTTKGQQNSTLEGVVRSNGDREKTASLLHPEEYTQQLSGPLNDSSNEKGRRADTQQQDFHQRLHLLYVQSQQRQSLQQNMNTTFSLKSSPQQAGEILSLPSAPLEKSSVSKQVTQPLDQTPSPERSNSIWSEMHMAQNLPVVSSVTSLQYPVETEKTPTAQQQKSTRGRGRRRGKNTYVFHEGATRGRKRRSTAKDKQTTEVSSDQVNPYNNNMTFLVPFPNQMFPPGSQPPFRFASQTNTVFPQLGGGMNVGNVRPRGMFHPQVSVTNRHLAPHFQNTVNSRDSSVTYPAMTMPPPSHRMPHPPQPAPHPAQPVPHPSQPAPHPSQPVPHPPRPAPHQSQAAPRPPLPKISQAFRSLREQFPGVDLDKPEGLNWVMHWHATQRAKQRKTKEDCTSPVRYPAWVKVPTSANDTAELEKTSDMKHDKPNLRPESPRHQLSDNLNTFHKDNAGTSLERTLPGQSQHREPSFTPSEYMNQRSSVSHSVAATAHANLPQKDSVDQSENVAAEDYLSEPLDLSRHTKASRESPETEKRHESIQWPSRVNENESPGYQTQQSPIHTPKTLSQVMGSPVSTLNHSDLAGPIQSYQNTVRAHAAIQRPVVSESQPCLPNTADSSPGRDISLPCTTSTFVHSRTSPLFPHITHSSEPVSVEKVQANSPSSADRGDNQNDRCTNVADGMGLVHPSVSSSTPATPNDDTATTAKMHTSIVESVLLGDTDIQYQNLCWSRTDKQAMPIPAHQTYPDRKQSEGSQTPNPKHLNPDDDEISPASGQGGSQLTQQRGIDTTPVKTVLSHVNLSPQLTATLSGPGASISTVSQLMTTLSGPTISTLSQLMATLSGPTILTAPQLMATLSGPSISTMSQLTTAFSGPSISTVSQPMTTLPRPSISTSSQMGSQSPVTTPNISHSVTHLPVASPPARTSSVHSDKSSASQDSRQTDSDLTDAERNCKRKVVSLPVKDFFSNTPKQNTYSSLLMAKIASQNKRPRDSYSVSDEVLNFIPPHTVCSDVAFEISNRLQGNSVIDLTDGDDDCVIVNVSSEDNQNEKRNDHISLPKEMNGQTNAYTVLCSDISDAMDIQNMPSDIPCELNDTENNIHVVSASASADILRREIPSTVNVDLEESAFHREHQSGDQRNDQTVPGGSGFDTFNDDQYTSSAGKESAEAVSVFSNQTVHNTGEHMETAHYEQNSNGVSPRRVSIATVVTLPTDLRIDHSSKQMIVDKLRSAVAQRPSAGVQQLENGLSVSNMLVVGEDNGESSSQGRLSHEKINSQNADNEEESENNSTQRAAAALLQLSSNPLYNNFTVLPETSNSYQEKVYQIHPTLNETTTSDQNGTQRKQPHHSTGPGKHVSRTGRRVGRPPKDQFLADSNETKATGTSPVSLETASTISHATASPAIPLTHGVQQSHSSAVPVSMAVPLHNPNSLNTSHVAFDRHNLSGLQIPLNPRMHPIPFTFQVPEFSSINGRKIPRNNLTPHSAHAGQMDPNVSRLMKFRPQNPKKNEHPCECQTTLLHPQNDPLNIREELLLTIHEIGGTHRTEQGAPSQIQNSSEVQHMINARDKALGNSFLVNNNAHTVSSSATHTASIQSNGGVNVSPRVEVGAGLHSSVSGDFMGTAEGGHPVASSTCSTYFTAVNSVHDVPRRHSFESACTPGKGLSPPGYKRKYSASEQEKHGKTLRLDRSLSDHRAECGRQMPTVSESHHISVTCPTEGKARLQVVESSMPSNLAVEGEGPTTVAVRRPGAENISSESRPFISNDSDVKDTGAVRETIRKQQIAQNVVARTISENGLVVLSLETRTSDPQNKKARKDSKEIEFEQNVGTARLYESIDMETDFSNTKRFFSVTAVTQSALCPTTTKQVNSGFQTGTVSKPHDHVISERRGHLEQEKEKEVASMLAEMWQSKNSRAEPLELSAKR